MSVKLIVVDRTGTTIKDNNDPGLAFQQAKVRGDLQMGYHPTQLIDDISELLMINQ
ncbi:hypothetical protein [Pedobacter polysacchareus]|nr:hypothetical protein [Pedobacter polysacchareus]